MFRVALDLTGKRFGRLAVLQRDGYIRGGAAWLCRCDCGKVVRHQTADLRGLRRLSCGCLMREIVSKNATKRQTIHGLSKTRTYSSWKAMHSRCEPTAKSRMYYYDRGISICDRWDSFESFLEDMGERPPDTSLDRIDNDKGYFPGNCRWATPKEQRANCRPRGTCYVPPRPTELLPCA